MLKANTFPADARPPGEKCGIVNFLTGFGLYSTALFTPLFFQGVLGSTATGSGGLLTPMMLAMVLGAIVSGRRLSRKGGSTGDRP